MTRTAMLDLLWAFAAVFALLWIFGFAVNFTLGGALHVLLVLAAITVAVRLILGREPAHT